MQLAGHLRGKALQEWNLLLEGEKSTYQDAVKKLKDVLGPGSRVLAAQDFRHTCQEEGEAVSAFIRRLERAFRVAHGCDQLHTETRSILLFGQAQDGLRQELMRSPSVSGALSYQELCAAAKNEEKRLSELRKRQQYSGQKRNQHSGNNPQSKPDITHSRGRMTRGPTLQRWRPHTTRGASAITVVLRVTMPTSAELASQRVEVRRTRNPPVPSRLRQSNHHQRSRMQRTLALCCSQSVTMTK